jgi:hypothetical protein
MSNTKTGGAAFPMNWVKQEAPNLNVILEQRGMTLRDYFAAKALPAIYKDATETARNDGWPDEWRMDVAEEAYEMADAMLKARDA